MNADPNPPEAEEGTIPQDPPMPVKTIDEALPLLRRPFAPGAVKWKVQSEWPSEGEATGAIVVGYIDARLVSARLNKVVGGNWSEKPGRVADTGNALLCELTVFDQTHVDLGVGQGRTAEMKLKAVHSDSLKRTAVRFGVGEPNYAFPEIRLGVSADGDEESDGTPTIGRVKYGRRQGRAGYLSDKVEAYLRERYSQWLREHGEEAFGRPLDHGDAAEGSVGEGVVEGDGEAESAVAVPVVDDEAKQLVVEIRERREAILAIDSEALPAQTFDTALAEREHSHDRLRDFLGNLGELLGNIERFAELEGLLAGKLDEADLKKVVDRAKRRGSRAERVEVLEKAWAEATGEGGSDNGGE